MSTLRIDTKAAGKTKPTYNDYMLSLTEAYNSSDGTNISKIHAKSTPTRQVLIGEVNHYNDDYKDEFFDATDYTTFDIQNELTDTLRLFTTNLSAAHESVSKLRQKSVFNLEIDISSAAFKEFSNEGIKLWYQFDNKDRTVVDARISKRRIVYYDSL